MKMEKKTSWDLWVEEALSKLQSLKLLRSLRPIYLSNDPNDPPKHNPFDINGDDYEVFDKMHQWDISSVHVSISNSTFQKWLLDIPSSGNEIVCTSGISDLDVEKSKKLLLFSSNDYLGLSSHPTIGKAAAKAALEHGMGPRGSALICGYTNYHRLLESSLANLKKKEIEKYFEEESCRD